MATQKKEYVRLPGSGMRRGGSAFFSITRERCLLWLGNNHLLQVESQGGYSESYKRFYFRDIQAMLLRKTQNGLVGNIVWGSLAGLFGLWTLSVDDPAGKITLLVITCVWAAFLFLNFLYGPTCICHLQTAVHLEELPSLRRLRRARKVIARLKPLIDQEQGALTREEAGAQYDARLQRMNLSPAVTVGQPGVIATSSAKPYHSRMHQIFFGALIVDALICSMNMFLPSVSLVLMGIVIGTMLIGIGAVALIKQHDTDLKSSAVILTWVAAFYLVGRYFIGHTITAAVLSPGQADTFRWEYITTLASLQPLETPWLLVVLIFCSLTSIVLALCGLLEMRSHNKQKQALNAMPPPTQMPS